MTITFGSLFAGIGGIDLGLERAGMACKWQVEIDPFCRKVLAKHWPDVRRFEDVRECGKHNLQSVDLIAGGFPCQPHSVAGKRKGAADDRDLWPEYRRIIAELRPTWVLGENVPNIEHTILDKVLSDLESESYEVAVFNLPAAAFNAPHRRHRLFIVGYAIGSANEGIHTRGSGRIGLHMAGNPLPPPGRQQSTIRPGGNGSHVAYANVERLQKSTHPKLKSISGSQEKRKGCKSCGASATTGGNWQTEPDVGRVADGVSSALDGIARGLDHWHTEPDLPRVAKGIPNRVKRLKGLGNAVVPQVAEFIGRMIVEADGVMGY